METKEIDKINGENKTPLIKNICYEMDSNKLMINDNENNHYLCDIFGRRKIKFLPNITGSLNRYKRQNLLQGKNLSYFQTTAYISPDKGTPQKNNNFSYLSNKSNKNHAEYYPTIRRFEGYSKFPRPIGPPLVNIPNYDINEKNKRKIIDKLDNYYDEESAKNDIKRKNENKGVSYITAQVNDFDLLMHDTEQSLQLIRNTLDNFREEYKLKLNIMNKDPNVKALYQFRKKLLLNKNSKFINGRVLDDPPEKIKKDYRIINSLIHKSGYSYDNKNIQNTIENNIYNKIKYNRNNKTISNLDKKYNFKNNSILRSKDRLNNLYNSKDFTMGRLIDMDFGLSSDKTKINLTTTDKDEKKSINQNTEENKTGGIEDAYKETEETMNNNSNIISINIGNTEKILEEKNNNHNELSFISYMSENEKKYSKENSKKIKSIGIIKNNVEHNNELLKGFREKERITQTIYPKSRILKLKTNGDLYRENLKLLRLTNSEAFKIQEQKDLYDLKMLEKKIKISTINANNLMKGKTLKAKKKNLENN